MKASPFQFTNPVLTKLEFNVNPDFKRSKNVAPEITNSFSIGISRVEGKPKAKVTLDLNLNKSMEMAPFYLESSISALFQWDETLEDSVVNTLLSVNAPALLLSYLRPIIAGVTNVSPYPPYNVPFINFCEEE